MNVNVCRKRALQVAIAFSSSFLFHFLRLLLIKGFVGFGLTISSVSLFTGNNSSAIYLYNSNLYMSGKVHFINNEAEYGGGVYVSLKSTVSTKLTKKNVLSF